MLCIQSQKDMKQLFAKMTRAVHTEINTHDTSSKCTSRTQLKLECPSPRGKQQNGSLSYEGEKQFKEIYIRKDFHLWLGFGQTF